jgi:HTH-type transcriptional regulator / antitoxin HipB
VTPALLDRVGLWRGLYGNIWGDESTEKMFSSILNICAREYCELSIYPYILIYLRIQIFGRGGGVELRTMADVGAWVRAVRKGQGLTQTELANRMGVTQSMVSRLENGHPRMEAQTLLDAFDALATPLQAGHVGLALSDTQHGDASEPVRASRTSEQEPPTVKDLDQDDPFDDVFSPLRKKS